MTHPGDIKGASMLLRSYADEVVEHSRQLTKDETDRLAKAIETLLAYIETLNRERERLIGAVGEHLTVRSDYLARAEAAEALLAREGWVWAPCEPTPEMLEAARPAFEEVNEKLLAAWARNPTGPIISKDPLPEAYRAMISMAGGGGKP